MQDDDPQDQEIFLTERHYLADLLDVEFSLCMWAIKECLGYSQFDSGIVKQFLIHL